MAQMRPPEEVLYAFSQWLHQWADYVLSQAERFTVSANPDDPSGDTDAAGDPPVPQEGQPPAHWFELVHSEPPPHWLALFEEYGLEPPEIGAPPGDANLDTQTPEAVPHLLQDWLGDFQRGLERFAQQPVSLSRDFHPVEPATPAAPSAQTLTPGPSVTRRDADSPTPAQFSQVQVRAAGGVLRYPSSKEEASPKRQSARPGTRVADPVPGAGSDPASISEQDGVEARSTPVRLRLNPRPSAAMPNPAAPAPSNVGVTAQSAYKQPSQAVTHPVARLYVGVPAPIGKPLSAKPAPFVELVQEARESEPVPLLSPIAVPDPRLSRVKPAEVDLLAETDPDLIHAPIRRREDDPKSSLLIKEQKEQSTPEWSQPAAAHWPELPERLPPVQPPSNVLADPAHRMRINREQRGRPWNA